MKFEVAIRSSHAEMKYPSECVGIREGLVCRQKFGDHKHINNIKAMKLKALTRELVIEIGKDEASCSLSLKTLEDAQRIKEVHPLCAMTTKERCRLKS